MRPDPPADLVELLERLKLATADKVRSVYPLVRKLAGELPSFSPVWVDALALAGLLTPFQAMKINAGRGEQLHVGPYILKAPLLALGYAEYYRAARIDSRREVHLLVAAGPETSAADVISRVMSLSARLKTLRNRHIAELLEAGMHGERIWIALCPDEATPLGDLLLNVGRLPGNAVLEIARQMAASLGALEAAGVAHGDLSVASVWLADDGSIQLRHPGVRGILRPTERLLAAEASPVALDGISPERVNNDGRPTVASDLFACGCLWWKLLAGRSPMVGATSMGKLRLAAARKIADVRRYSPEAPALLVSAIEACLQPDSDERPASFAAVAELLGAPTQSGRRELGAAASQLHGSQSTSIVSAARRVLRSKDSPAWIATIAGCLAVIIGVSWPMWHSPSGTPASRQPANNRSLAVASTIKSIEPHDARRKSPKPAEMRHADAQQAAYLELSAAIEPLILAGDETVAWHRLLRPGQVVRGRPGERPSISVPTSGIVLAVEDVQFQGVDFVWRPAPDAAIDPERLVMIELQAARTTFRDCTFSALSDERNGQPVAIRWTGPRRQRQLSPAGRLQIAGCSIRGVAAAIDCRWNSPLSVDLSETLFLGPGPLLRIDHVPRIDEPIEIQLMRSTFRDAAALVGIHADRIPQDEAGTIGIAAKSCAFAPAQGGALVLFASSESPARLAKSIQWSGDGSVLSSEAPTALWLSRGPKSTGREIEVGVEGIVSSPLEFAGPAAAGSSASRLLRWQGAAQSDEPPGIADGLPNAITPHNVPTPDRR